ncbi:MAG: LytTR family DNA-binding domain-containing protein [Bacteroidota bacterium]
MKNKISFKTLDGYLFLLPDEINFIKSEDIYAFVYYGGARHFINCSLKSLEEMLPRDSFLRCHRSYLVNLDRVVKFKRTNKFTLLLENGLEVPISRQKKELVMRKLGIKE